MEAPVNRPWWVVSAHRRLFVSITCCPFWLVLPCWPASLFYPPSVSGLKVCDFFFKNVSWKHFWAEHLAFASSHQWMHLWGAWHTPLLQMQGWKAGAAISELVSAWFVYPWILKPAIVMCRRRSNTSSAWKYRNTESWVRARLNHCATPSSSPSLAQNTATIFELKLTLYLYKGIQL